MKMWGKDIHCFAAAPFPVIVNEKTNITPVGAILISTRVRFSFCNTSLFNIIMDVLSKLLRENVSKRKS